MKLYDLELSGNCYKVRLFLSLIGRDYDLCPVDFLGGEHKRAPLTALNPFAELPILEDGDIVLRDSQAMLVYLARKYADESWLPTEPLPMARVMEWLMVAENEVARGPNDARLHDKFGYELDRTAAILKGERLLDLVEAHLEGRDWLAGEGPTIADIAVFPYLALGHEGGVPLGERPRTKGWIARIEKLDGFIGMPELELT